MIVVYAQRHADAAVALDDLAELMGDEALSSTQAYYQVGEKCRRGAVDRLAQHQFDRHGALGQVSVLYGTCREPSNVLAGGVACAYRFRWVGGDHFRTDVSPYPSSRPTCKTCSAAENGRWPQASSTTGPRPKPRSPKTRSARSKTSSERCLRPDAVPGFRRRLGTGGAGGEGAAGAAVGGWQENYPGVDVRRVLTQERPVERLLERAAGAQLVVVGSRGNGGFSGMLLGSTSQALIRHATCPLMVVRPARADLRGSDHTPTGPMRSRQRCRLAM